MAVRCALLLHTGCGPCPWQVVNAKPYHPFNPQARIVHFHVRRGPMYPVPAVLEQCWSVRAALAHPCIPPLASHLHGTPAGTQAQRLRAVAADWQVPIQRPLPAGKLGTGFDAPSSALAGEGLASARPSPANQGPPQPLPPPPFCLLQGFAAGLCRYAAEYFTIVPEWLEAGRLVRLCHGAAG